MERVDFLELANGIAKAIKYLTKNTNQEKLKRKRKWVLLEERSKIYLSKNSWKEKKLKLFILKKLIS